MAKPLFPVALDQRFAVIIFDWDGTAVTDRRASAVRMIAAVEQLLLHETLCVIITGTNIQHLETQALRSVSTEAKRNLYVCTNRGSEVFGFDPQGATTLLFRRNATQAEDRALDCAAERLKNELSGFGLSVEVISNRLNRRKVDLIPIPKWSEPKKSEFNELLQDVGARLRAVGVPGELPELERKAVAYAVECGLSAPKVTSDIKHVEIGLTDKGDSIRWIYENLVLPRKIPHEKVVFFGDEFGAIGGVPGSDALMRIREFEDTLFFSVGIEPEGTPPWVTHLGGGPARFVDFLEREIEITAEEHVQAQLILRPDRDSSWLLEQEGFDPSQEREMESLFAIGNGYLGVRSSLAFPIPTSQSDLFLAGIYDKKAAMPPYSEVEVSEGPYREDPFGELVAFPSPFVLGVSLGGARVGIEKFTLAEHSRVLDLRSGIYFERYLFTDQEGRKTRIESSRFASLADPHLMVQQVEITCINHSSPLAIETTRYFPKVDTHYPHLLIEELSPGHHGENLIHLRYRTRESRYGISLCVREFIDDEPLIQPKLERQGKVGEPILFRRYSSVFSSRDGEKFEKSCLQHSRDQTWDSIRTEVAEHRERWDGFWQGADIRFEGRPELTQAQRFNLYHLRIAAGYDPNVSIGARGLTGRAYEGHVFWDTEIFMFPFYLYTEPGLAKELLLYRYHTLNGARKRAAGLGFRGACYAWESTVTGEDLTPKGVLLQGGTLEIPIFNGKEQIHVTADVAHAVWMYWDATLDSDFMIRYGAEILAETARFWASRGKFEKDGKFHIRGVVGPDEYHYGVGDNAYTNWMARLNLEKSAWVAEWLSREAPDRFRELGLQPDESRTWAEMAAKMATARRSTEGVIEQFDGFFSIRSVSVSRPELLKAPITRLFSWNEVNSLRILKQADVLMIPFVFPGALSPEEVRANYRYYEALTEHGSSLSLCVHAAVAAQAGLFPEATAYWEQSLNLDLTNAMHNVALGVHAGGIGGTWQALVFHLLRIRLSETGVKFRTEDFEQLLPSVSGISMKLYYRGRRFPVEIPFRRRRAA